MRWKTFTPFCRKFIQQTLYQILSQLPEFYRPACLPSAVLITMVGEFYRRYYKKHFSLIFLDTAYNQYVALTEIGSSQKHAQELCNTKCASTILTSLTSFLPSPLLRGDRGRRGWYDCPQSELRPRTVWPNVLLPQMYAN